MNILLQAITNNWPVLFRGGLYTAAAFLATGSEKILPSLWENKWPTAQCWTGSVLVGTIGAILTLRAYYDGSAQRHKDEKTNGNGNGETK